MRARATGHLPGGTLVRVAPRFLITQAQDVDSNGDSVMVALIPEQEATIALMEAADSDIEFDDQHLTLIYLGSVEEAGGDAGRERLHRAVYDFSIHSGHDVLSGTANGWGVFYNEGETVLVALWDIPGIAEFRAALKGALGDHGVPLRQENHGFTPHQSMRYVQGLATVPGPVDPQPQSVFTHVVIAWGNEWSSVALESALGATALRHLARQPGDLSRWDESKHPRGGNPANKGEFSKAPGSENPPSSPPEGRGTVVPESKRPDRSRTPQAPAAAPSVRLEHPPTPKESAKYAQREPQYKDTSLEAYTLQLRRGDLYAGEDPEKFIPAGKYPEGDPRNDPEYEAREAQIESLAGQKGKYVLETAEEAARTGVGGSTDTLFDKRTDPETGATNVWDPERAALHKRIVAQFMATHTRGVPREGKCVILGGPSGAGKSTFLKQSGAMLGIQLDSRGNPVNYAVINPDDFKEDVPVDEARYPGVAPNEMASIKHEESSELAKLATATLMAQGYNVILDITLGNGAKALSKYVTAPYAAGYHDYTVALVDGDMRNSRQNAGNRYKMTNPTTAQRRYTGRFVSMPVIEEQAPTAPGFRSHNAQEFMKVAADPHITRAVVYDPFNRKAGLQDVKAAIHEVVKQAGLSGILRAEGGPTVPENAQYTEITDRIRSFADGKTSREDLLRYLTTVRYQPQDSCPYEKGTPKWWYWHNEEKQYVPGSFDEVRLANALDLLPDDLYQQVVQTLWDRAEHVDAT